MNGEVYKRKVDRSDELLARILDAAARVKKRQNQLRRTTRDLRTRVAKCTEVDGGIFRTFIANCNKSVTMDRDSSVCTATRYRLDGPGIESRWGGEIFRTPPARPWGPPSLLYNWVPSLSPGGVKGQGRGVDHPSPSSAEVEERVELYLYSTSEPSLPVLE